MKRNAPRSVIRARITKVAQLNEPQIRWGRIAPYVIGMAALCALIAVSFSRQPQHPVASSEQPQVADSEAAPAVAESAPLPTIRPVPSVSSEQPTRPRAMAHLAAPSPIMRQLVDGLVNLDASTGPWTEAQTAAWRGNLQKLVQQGTEAVPAISEFLAKNVDFDFGDGGKEALGYKSARGAMIDALAQIGGPVAEVALANVLQSTADPKEIALVSQYLDRLNPGVHQQEAVNAARQALDALAQGSLPNRDMAPLFEVLQQYGGPAVAFDLERYAKHWNYYASIVLGQLPEGQGIPSLIALTQQGNNPAALQMLAQAATQSPDARTALLDQARQDKLSAVTWATLVPILAGNQTFFQDSSFGNPISEVYPSDLRSTYLSATRQSFFTAPPGAMTLDQIDRQNALIDELLGATSNPAAVRALQQSKALLAQRMPQVATTGK